MYILDVHTCLCLKFQGGVYAPLRPLLKINPEVQTTGHNASLFAIIQYVTILTAHIQ